MVRQGVRSEQVLRSPLIQSLARFTAAVLVGIVALLGTQYERAHNPQFDVFDEGAHFDYVSKLVEGHIPDWGSLYEQETLLIADCLGNALVSTQLDCSVRERVPEQFAPSGYSYEAQQPPLGYLVYLAGYSMSNDQPPAARLDFVRAFGGAITIGILVVLTGILAQLLALGFLRTTLMSIVVMLSPISLHAFSTVSNDAFTVVASLAFLVGLCVARRSSTKAVWFLGIVAGVVLGATKSYLVLIPAGVLLALFLIDCFDTRSLRTALRAITQRAMSLFSLLSAAVGVIVTVGFAAWQTVRSPATSSEVLSALLGFRPTVDHPRLSTMISSIANLSNAWLGTGTGLAQIVPQLFVTANAALLILIGVALARRLRDSMARMLAISWIVVVIAFGIGWPLLLFIQGGFDFDAPTRYALCLLPLAGAAVALGIVKTTQQERSTAIATAEENHA